MYFCTQNYIVMITEYKVFDDGIWLPRHELKRCYDEIVASLETNQKYSHINSRSVGQLYLLEELIYRIR